MIVDLYKSGINLAELSSEYSIAKSTINGWIKDVKEIKVDENEVITLKEVIEFINNNKTNHDIKTICAVLGVARSTYYKSLSKTKSKREIENEELKVAITRIYKANKGIYDAPMIHPILGTEEVKVSFKRIQRLMKELYLCAITIKKYRPYSSKKISKDLENFLKRDFTTTSINEKCVEILHLFILSKIVGVI